MARQRAFRRTLVLPNWLWARRMREPSPRQGRASRPNPHPNPSPAGEGAARSKVALFREREDANASAARLRRFGFSVVCLPVIEIRTRPVRPQRARYEVVVATSDKAFHADGPSDTSSPLYVVGARTGHAAEARGWRLASPPARDADELVRMLTDVLKPEAKVLYLAGRDRKEAIEAALSEALSSKSSKPMRRRGARPGVRQKRDLSHLASRRCTIRAARRGWRQRWRRQRA